MAPAHPPETVVRTSTDLLRLWQSLIGPDGFSVASVWLVFLDAEGRVQPVIVPIDDIPAEPDDAFLSGLAKVVVGLVGGGTVSSVAMLLSRPGPPAMTAADRRWAAALRTALGGGLAAWPVHLATPDRIRVFAPDDLVAE